ncbi:phage repressor protein CI [Serratia marcescens]|nr:phage repressor protein CI [Serratia marcescens]MBH3042492.1 phage repressor protein CI [Serratia marcescens]HAU4289595.1 phage repressor protein [Serratia marcescens]HAU4321265.1 phage repressor protein [Serratia marcescens]HEI8723225.1 phage repressor protein CI [Serratia marcescens]
MINQDTKAVIDRMLLAYGLKTKLALCEALDITASALANRQLRNAFPAEYVLKCALDTGASLRWLTYGQGEMFEQNVVTAPSALAVSCKTLSARKLIDEETQLIDKAFLPKEIKSPVIINHEKIKYIATYIYDEIYDGSWLIDIDGNVSIREVVRVPGNKVNVYDTNTSFECSVDDLKIIAKILMICKPV